MIRAELGVIAHEEIEVAVGVVVGVVVGKGGAGAHPGVGHLWAGYLCRGRRVGEGAVAFVAVENIRAVAGNVEVEVAVVVGRGAT